MVAGLVSYLRRHHIGLLALCIALTGTAYAATLPNNSVGTKQLKKNAVTAKKVKNGAVTGAKIKNGAVNSDKVKNGSLLSADFKSGQLPAGPQGPRPGPARSAWGGRATTSPSGRGRLRSALRPLRAALASGP